MPSTGPHSGLYRAPLSPTSPARNDSTRVTISGLPMKSGVRWWSASGDFSRIRWVPSVVRPPACSTMTVGKRVHFLLRLALHIGPTGGAGDVVEPGPAHVAIDDPGREADVTKQPREGAGRVGKPVLLLQNELFERFEVAQIILRNLSVGRLERGVGRRHRPRRELVDRGRSKRLQTPGRGGIAFGADRSGAGYRRARRSRSATTARVDGA